MIIGVLVYIGQELVHRDLVILVGIELLQKILHLPSIAARKQFHQFSSLQIPVTVEVVKLEGL